MPILLQQSQHLHVICLNSSAQIMNSNLLIQVREVGESHGLHGEEGKCILGFEDMATNGGEKIKMELKQIGWEFI